MTKKPSAANITHGLAQLGGGSKEEGGGGMLEGVANIFKAGVQYGAQLSLDGKAPPENIELSEMLSLEDGSNDEDQNEDETEL